MRYLKRFNESVDIESQLRDFSESYLAYLLDGDFELSVIWMGGDNFRIGRKVSWRDSNNRYNINLCKLNDYSSAAGFTWNEVKDYFIPFIHMLDKQYEIMDDTETYRRVGSTDEPCISLYNSYCQI